MSDEEPISAAPTPEETTETQLDAETRDPDINRRVLRNNRIIELGSTCTREGQYECSQCDRRFSLASSLLYHLQDDHEDEPELEQSETLIAYYGPRYQCDICEGTFSTNKNVRRHKETVHERLRPYECDVCHQSFGTRYTMTQHKKARHKPPGTPRIIVRRHACPVCSKMFTTKGNVAYHQRRVHENVMPFHCAVCQRRFGCKAHLVRHQRCVHEQLKLYHCEECGKLFGDKGSVNEHKACVHSNEVPYRCSHCNRRFATKRALKCHEDGVHTAEREYQCTDCNKAYKRSQALIRHRMLVHGKGFFYPCSDCDARCLGPVSLQHHRRTFHGKSDTNRFSSELPKVEQLIGGEPVDLCEWNLEQMQRELEENHFVEAASMSSASDTDDVSDSDSERTLPLSDYSDDELLQESNTSDPVGWVIEIDTSSATGEPDELEITKAIVPSYSGLDVATPTLNGPHSVRRKITFVQDEDHNKGRNSVARSSLASDRRRSKPATSVMAGRRLASLRIDKSKVYRLMHTQPCSHQDVRRSCHGMTEQVSASTTCLVQGFWEDVQTISTENDGFIVKPTAIFRSMRKRLGLFHLLKIARAPTKRKLQVQFRKCVKVDSIAEELARNLVATSIPGLSLPEDQQLEVFDSAAMVPVQTS